MITPPPSYLAILILLANKTNSWSHNTAPSVKFHFQLPSLLVHWSHWKKKYPGNLLKAQSTPTKHKNQVCKSVHLQTDQWSRRFTTLVVSLNRCDLFLLVVVYMQEQQKCSHKTGHIGTKIISNGRSKISFVSLLRKKLFPFWYYVSVSWFSG